MPKATPTAKTKDEALRTALAEIEKSYGAGSVVRLGDAGAIDVDAISTGALALDLALGVGGLARGRITEIIGPESAGKCLVAETFIATPEGIFTLGELFARNGIVPSCSNKTTSASVPVLNRFGLSESTTTLLNNNRRPIYAVETNRGTIIKSTPAHPHLIMNERGSWVWRKAKDLKPGDYLVALDTLEVEGSHSLPAEEAFFVGVLIADGHFAPFRVQVSNNDPAILENILQIGPQVFSAKPHLYNNGESVAVHFNTKEGVGQFYERFGFGPGTAADKKLGVFCRSLDQASTAALIKGYMDCESSIDTKGIEVTSASRLLLEEVSLTLRRFGIHGTISQKRVSTYPNNTYWRLFLSTGAAALYRDRIGTASSLRAEQLATLRSDRSFDSIPHMAGLLRDLYESSETTRTHDDLVRDPIMGRCLLTRDRLQKILEFKWSPSSALSRLEEIAQTNYKYEEVVSVKEMPPEPVFDLTTEKTHSFVANGLVTHNSTVALHVVAEAQKAGGTCAYVDAEHAVDPDYARRLGVDTDSLLFSQPDSGEQALEIVDRLVRSGAMDVIVIDSVAALVPRAELEGEMGSAHVGLQARLMSQAMRKLAGNINRAKTVCIFINQIREKVGVVYGSPEVAPGGRALKFYASVRLDLRRIETLKEGAEAVGIRVKAKVAKNKCAPPLRVCEFDLFYASGIDSLGSVLDVAADLDVVRKSGGWYSYGETKLGNGKAAARETLSNHPALVAEISDKVYRQLKGENE